MVNSTDFGLRLQKILDFYGLSAAAFSEAISFNRSTISHLLSGRNKPSLEFVLKVVDKFPEVEIYWLLNGKGSFPSSKIDKITLQKPSSQNESKEKLTKEVKNSTLKASRSTKNNKDSAIERIVIFYKDGSFNSYEN